jgi:hypothetical protein
MVSAIFRGGVDGFSYFSRGCRWFQLFLKGGADGFNYFRGDVDSYSYS